MRYYFTFALFYCLVFSIHAQIVEDSFEGDGNITTWYGDACAMNNNFANPYQEGINNSATVLRYHDTGGQYSNVRFDVSENFDFSTNSFFSLKIYVPSSGLTGSQTNQISLKLQDGTLAEPWVTQSEIIKPIHLNQWQEITFDFENDTYFNLDSGSLPPSVRTDFNRIVIQINGENNFDEVLAYIDDIHYDQNAIIGPVFDQLVWSDEFDGNGAVDPMKWHHQTQLILGDSWANNEQQHYTNRTINSFVDNGTLKIVARGETFTDQGHTKNYTSARLNSKFAFTYGRVEVRAKLPSISGTWPAIWLLGKNINEVGGYWTNEGYGTTTWPWCGEIDIMEPNIAKNQILGTLHWNNGSGYEFDGSSVATINSDTSQNFHIYALEWTPEEIRIYMDDALVHEINTFSPFDEDFYILLNVAMGGNLGGPIVPGFIQDVMEIDYVRVYQESVLSVVSEENYGIVQFYPNPVKNQLHISLPQNMQQDFELQIIDIHGRIINRDKKNISKKSIVHDVSPLSVGVYFVKLLFENGEERTFKIIKE